MSEAAREYVHQRDRSASEHETERIGVLAHELRNQLSNATIAFELLARGSMGIGGSTGALLGRGLRGLRETIDRALAGVRGDTGPVPRERISLASVLAELDVPGAAEAEAREIHLIVERGDTDIEVEVAPQALLSAIWNLLQNALKFTPPRGTVTVRTQLIGPRVVIDVVDQCGGLPAGSAEALFRPFEQRGSDRSGLGLGLAIVRRDVEANGGTIHVRDVPGEGCVFSIHLPRATAPMSQLRRE
jgi:signal transduction histidine kinase